MSAEYFWFFLALALAMAVQLYYTAQQTRRFMAEVRRLRRSGTVAIGLGGRRWLGRKVYVALAADAGGLVTGAIVLRGITQFARPRPAPRYTGRTTTELADPSGGLSERPGDPPGHPSPAERAAARQAAETLLASRGWHPIEDSAQDPAQAHEPGKEGTHQVSSLGQ